MILYKHTDKYGKHNTRLCKVLSSFWWLFYHNFGLFEIGISVNLSLQKGRRVSKTLKFELIDFEKNGWVIKLKYNFLTMYLCSVNATDRIFFKRKKCLFTQQYQTIESKESSFETKRWSYGKAEESYKSLPSRYVLKYYSH